ncbi:lipid-A-disaccharide synthase N-terminal domain-containing protein [Luteibacter aegosomatis]|uniref:lipid-A-disaccharide synthase N-terminal domain-containing protein n=1 Tax=Luteibacter aegosomatis TaxID=2911537 RepID=UPI001FFB6045|nr:lipid-A-disaccharide synthase N-terminal domain-containing protein [Luteibacter aegosomatis]UPG87078.1 lipid-A-disaccharide synthase N-terminal domain-containing protein [Luteibacter aegosomatis]
MHEVLADIHLIILTPWKLVGLLGTLLFTARWFVQFYATKKNKKVTVPMSFWYLSVSGSVLTLAYFIWGKNDSVGIIQTAFPMLVSFYNVFAHLRHKDTKETVKPGGPEDN